MGRDEDRTGTGEKSVVPPLAHGGNLNAAAECYGRPIEEWLDLSTGINPIAYPIPHLPDRLWTRLPERQSEERLLGCARRYYAAPKEADIVAAPGTQALIQIIPRLRPVSRVCVLGPTYGEHAHCWRGAGHDVEERAYADGWPDQADVVVVVNPNNPDGHMFDQEPLLARAAELSARGGWLIIDEAFGDMQPAASVARHAGVPSMIILRSFGKFFGLAGLRLGFALSDKEIGSHIRNALGPWSVAGPALEIGACALGDEVWIDDTRNRLFRDAQRLDALLEESGHAVVGGTSLYRLISTQGCELHETLAQQGIWTRAFADRKHLLRFGVPASDEDFNRLAAALSCEEMKAVS